ncbi:hypothetical protein F0256_24620 [Vibrio europaeus]|nr:hypothetical protein [Vibrio europaeus]
MRNNLFNRNLTLSTAVIEKDAMALRLFGGVAPFLLEKSYEMEVSNQAYSGGCSVNHHFLCT